MNKFEHNLKLIAKAINEGAEDHEKGSKKPYEIKNEIVGSKGKYNQAVAAVKLIMEMIPGALSEKIKASLNNNDYSELPFDLEKYNFQEKIGRGFVSKVHLLESKQPDQPSYVLKLDYYNQGTVDELQTIARQQHREYEKIKKDYQSIPGLIPNEQTLIVADKKSKTPTIATLQEFVGGDLRDLFKEINKEELIRLLIENEGFREEFLEFVRISAGMAKEKNEFIDLLGKKNLSIVEKNSEPHLCFIDPHHISSPVSDNKKRIID